MAATLVPLGIKEEELTGSPVYICMITDLGYAVVGQKPNIAGRTDEERCFHRVTGALDEEDAKKKAREDHRDKNNEIEGDPFKCKCDCIANAEAYKKGCNW